ncbi:FAD-dependent monooxygenase [Chitiniphilus purpureus]|uniref:FAD-dependent monooxygenase n=1 Tax=Chitiniphilus purpureus TaxID=2981137 RepID=A0ABY6DKG7_9NEIS|nr:FAD-dependent monooxygenase [Chitiniphilus sp. CD1]UXY14855.1 FAD-dependent monooxygenase [Chitiniphilus sp. CD1]
MTSVDVAIAGGGPAGAAAAIVLARAGLRVLLAEARAGAALMAPRIGEGLPPSARPLLQELGVLDAVQADGHRTSPGTLACWGAASPHANDFLYQLHGTGWQLDRVRFDARLRETAAAAGARLIAPARLHLRQAADGSSPHLLDMQAGGTPVRTVQAQWLIDASGRNATLARALGAVRIRHDRLLAFHQRLASATAIDRDGRTWVEAVEEGWWYSVLLPSGERLIALLCDADADRRRALLGGGLWQALAGAPHLHRWCHAHGYRPIGRACGADACSQMLDRAAGRRWLAAGDAALAFDPLSSKGIATALYGGMQAAHALLAALAGDIEAPARFGTHLHHIHAIYRQQLTQFYALETRWPDSAFWSPRRNTTAAVTTSMA